MKNHIKCTPFNVTICISHVRNCVMGATPMAAIRDYHQCDILKSADSDEPVQPPFKLVFGQ